MRFSKWSFNRLKRTLLFRIAGFFSNCCKFECCPTTPLSPGNKFFPQGRCCRLYFDYKAVPNWVLYTKRILLMNGGAKVFSQNLKMKNRHKFVAARAWYPILCCNCMQKYWGRYVLQYIFNSVEFYGRCKPRCRRRN